MSSCCRGLIDFGLQAERMMCAQFRALCPSGAGWRRPEMPAPAGCLGRGADRALQGRAGGRAGALGDAAADSQGSGARTARRSCRPRRRPPSGSAGTPAGPAGPGSHGLVEDQQLWPLGDREGQGELGALPARQRPGPLARVEAELTDPPLGQFAVPGRVEPCSGAEVTRD
jgi:hypothetical protein